MNEYMKLAFFEAKEAFNEKNVPVGAVIVKGDEIIASAHNKKNSSNISIYHAEILCILEACKKLKSWYLDDCSMYVTLEPCDMCKAAIAESRIKNVYYMSKSNYYVNMSKNMEYVNYRMIDCNFNYANLLSEFFKNVRKM